MVAEIGTSWSYLDGLLAIALHAAANAIAVATLRQYGAIAAEVVLFVIAAVSLIAVFRMRSTAIARSA